MAAILAGVLPVFLLLALGYGLKKSDYLPDAAWRPIEKLAINVLYPGFLIPAIWNANLSGSAAGAAGAAAVTVSIIISTLTLLSKPLLPLSGPAYTSVFQGMIRWNSFVFLPVVQATFGPAGVGLAAVVIAAMIPVSNILSVVVLAKWGADQRGASPRALFRAMMSNPILLACLLGLALNFSGAPQPPGVSETLQLLGSAALPLGLIVAGAGLSFRELARTRVTVGVVVVVKMIVTPLAMWQLARLYGGDELAQGIALLCGAAPGAASAYVLARQMGGDAPLMAGIIAATTVFSVIGIPMALLLFHLT
jgi:malonate transporter